MAEIAVHEQPYGQDHMAQADTYESFSAGFHGLIGTMIDDVRGGLDRIGDAVTLNKLATGLAAGTALLGSLGLAATAEGAISGGGIGSVKLGQTENQVKKEVGSPHTASKSEGQAEWQYYIINGKIPLASLVVFTNPGGVASMETIDPSQRTSKGIGIGSKESSIKKAYSSATCQDITHCEVQTQSQGQPTVITFELSKQYPDFEHFTGPKVERVDEVYVSVASDAPQA